MGQFSDDCQWWWDGKTWTATAKITLPQLPMTEFEQSGKLALGRAEVAKGRREFWGCLSWLFGLLRGPNGRWSIKAFNGDKFDPRPVLDAWRNAVNSTTGM
jgi:hypothetical protein